MKKTLKNYSLVIFTILIIALLNSCEKKENNSDFCTDNSEIFGDFLTNDRFENGQNRYFYTFNTDCTLFMYQADRVGELLPDSYEYSYVKGELIYTGDFDYTNGLLNASGIYFDAETTLVNGRLLISEGRGDIKLKKVN
jgi:hypothetical protein